MNKIISIIVPVYNSEKTLHKCINSLIKQTYKNIEILLIDDGSTDKSEAICKEYEKVDKRIRYIRKNNTGVSSTRNLGIEESIGEYIQFVDSDDYVEINLCEIMIDTLISNSCDLVICGYKCIDEINNKETCITYKSSVFQNVNCMQNDFEAIYSDNLINIPWNKIYRKKYIKNVFDESLSLGEDLLFNLNYLKHIDGKVIVINEPLYCYVKNNNQSLTCKFREDRIDVGIYLNNEVHEFCKAKFNKYDSSIVNISLAYLVQESIDICLMDKNQTIKKKIKYIRGITSNRRIIELCNSVELYAVHSKISNLLIRYKLAIALLIFHSIKCVVKTHKLNLIK